jgi:hypothetical protein
MCSVDFRKIGCVAVALTCLVASVGAAEKPNIIVFLTDDQGYNDVGCFGSPNIKTPRWSVFLISVRCPAWN